MIRILIVEDDTAMGRGISLTLAQDGYELSQAYDCKTALKQFREKGFDLILLDVNLPDGSGLDVCREIRKSSGVPVIFLTANDLETDIVTGFEMGGDDYITKPFSLMVLRARVKAALRKNAVHTGAVYEFDGLALNFDRMEFIREGQSFTLSRTEQKLLRKLAENPGQVLTRDQLLDSVWANEAEFVDENALTVTIRRLRGKLERDPAHPSYIKTVYGLGYSWTGCREE